ncbi:MAG: hypothetical protein ACOCPM_07065 [Bacteroidales bacterium]
MKSFLFPLLLLTSYFTFSQNLILNPDFEAGSPQYYNNCGTNNAHCQEAKNFDANLNEWKGRLKIHEQLWHSPDWHYDQPYNKKIGVKTYELVQQKLDEKISANEFYIIKFRMKWEAYISDNIKFQFYLSKKKMKYKKESLSIFQSEKNHLCSERYKSLRGYEYQVESFSNLPYNPNIISQWFDIELYFQAPDNSNLDWFWIPVS